MQKAKAVINVTINAKRAIVGLIGGLGLIFLLIGALLNIATAVGLEIAS